MSDAALLELATAAGVTPVWKDVFGRTHEVQPPTLRAILAALDYPSASDADVRDSLSRVQHPSAKPVPLVTADAGHSVQVPHAAARYELKLEDGRVFDGVSGERGTGSLLPAVLEAGYHTLRIGDVEMVVAVAPSRCFTVPEAIGRPKGWGLAVQLYSLRRKIDAGLGDFQALAELARPAARHGAQALAISPVHAQFSADPDRFSPYAPSSRTALNILHGSIGGVANAGLAAEALVDWPAASRFRLGQMRRMFEVAKADAGQRAELERFAAGQGAKLREHALFEALHAHFFSTDPGLWHWQSWPAEYRDLTSSAVAEFAAAHRDEVDFHAWLQFRADLGLAEAQAACRSAGMGIGLVSDLAVGTDSGGSQCWSRQLETLLGLTVGAPPDLLQKDGQNWGLTAFSPTGLEASGFATYRDMLHTALAHSGGMRIDHAMGLNRLWVIPEGGSGADGAYLSFPETDFLRLIKLESQRHRAIVLAEDLGTVPDGFQDRLREAGIDGMRVLWFERDKENRFTSPETWTKRAAAMTSTHDLATVAGWWVGRDLDWREKLGQLQDPVVTRDERAADRLALWQVFRESGSAVGEAPGVDGVDAFAEAACVHVGRSACELVMLPIEDALALVEQPNLPGTLHEHPNWQRRLPDDVADVLEGGATPQRLAALNDARSH